MIPLKSLEVLYRFTKEIPQKGKVITIGSYHITIEEATNKKIELVKMILQE